MTDIARGLPCTDNGGVPPPHDAVTWQNKANAEVVGLWNRVTVALENVTGTNDIECTSVITIPGYVEGMSFWLTPVADSTGPCTIDIDEQGETDLVDRDGAALVSGSLRASRLYQIIRKGSAFRVVDPIIEQATVPYPPKYFSGFGTGTNATDTSNDIDIASGNCRSSDDTQNIILASALVKRADAVWAVGTNQGGMLQSDNLTGTISVTNAGTSITGSGTTFTTDFAVGDPFTTAGGQCRRITVITSNTAMTVESAWTATESAVTYKRGGKARSTLYNIFAIRRDSDGVVDVAFSARTTPVDLPSGWSTYRIIWHFATDTSAVNRAYTQLGYTNFLTSLYTESSPTGSGHTTITSLAPANAHVLLDGGLSIGVFSGAGGTGYGRIRDTIHDSNYNEISVFRDTAGSANTVAKSMVRVRLNASRQYRVHIDYTSVAGGSTLTYSLYLKGWEWNPAEN